MAARATVLPAVKEPTHVVPQSIPAGADVTVPGPLEVTASL